MPKTTVASASNEITRLLEEAASRGHLIVLRTSPPPHDEAQTAFLIAFNQLGLTPAEGRVLMALMENKHISREALNGTVLRADGTVAKSKTLDVHVFRLRRKLAEHGIMIDTIRGLGFALAKDARDKIERLLADAGIVMPADPAAAPD